MKLVVPLKLRVVLWEMKIAPPIPSTELFMKLLVPLKLSTVLSDAKIAPPLQSIKVSIFSRNIVVPVNVRLLL